MILLDGRAHGHIVTVPAHRSVLWFTTSSGQPEILADINSGLKDQLNRSKGQWERYEQLTALGPNIQGHHPYDCRQRLPDPPRKLRDGRTVRDVEQDGRWTQQLREFLEPLRDAPPPDDEQQVFLWMELTDILTHLNKYRNPVIRLP